MNSTIPTAANITNNGTTLAPAPSHRRNAGRLVALGLAACLTVGAPVVVAADEPTTGAESAATVNLDDPSVYARLTPRQQTAVDELIERHGVEIVRNVDAPPVASDTTSAAMAPSVLSWFGKEILAWGLGVGADAGFDGLSHALGFGRNGEALDRVHESLGDINARLDKINKDLQDIADEVVWGNFQDAHGDAAKQTNEIYEQSRDAAHYAALGVTPDRDELLLMVDRVNDALNDLGPRLITALGTGAVPSFVKLETHARPVSDTVEQWERILDAVERYRGAYAQGLLTLMWAAEFDEEFGLTTSVKVQGRSQAALERMEMVYDYLGAPYPQRPGDVPWIHTNGFDWAITNGDRAPYLDEVGSPMTHINNGFPASQLWLDNMVVTQFRQVDESLRETFENRGLNVQARWADGHEYSNDGSCSGFAKRHYMHNPLITIEGNSATVTKELYADACANMHPKDIETRFIEYNRTPRAAEIVADPAWQLISIPKNATTGLPALMDEESIRAVRDGLADLSFERGGGDAIDVRFDAGAYTGMELRDAGSGDVLASFDLADFSGAVGPLDAPSGAVEIAVGYVVDGDPTLLDARATSTLAVNPGASTVSLNVTI